MTEENYIQQLKSSLSKLNPYLVLLFGSYAYGKPDSESDIDILVVTNDNFTPQNFKAKHEVYMKVSKQIRHIKMKKAVDLIVHTIPMFQKFIKQDSSFAHEITTKGKILYKHPQNINSEGFLKETLLKLENTF